MSYDANKKITHGQLATTVGQVKSYIDAEIAKIPSDQFLDTTNSHFDYDFTWTVAKYPNSTNPNLEHKAVLVLVLKNEQGTVAYSFLDLSRLIDINKIDKVTSAVAGNLPKWTADGQLADSGVPTANVLTTADVASDTEVQEMLTATLGTTAPAAQTGD